MQGRNSTSLIPDRRLGDGRGRPAPWRLGASVAEKPQPLSSADALGAAERGNSVVLAAYLHAGGDPQAMRSRGFSLLHLAAGCSHQGSSA